MCCHCVPLIKLQHCHIGASAGCRSITPQQIYFDSIFCNVQVTMSLTGRKHICIEDIYTGIGANKFSSLCYVATTNVRDDVVVGYFLIRSNGVTCCQNHGEGYDCVEL